MGFQRISMSMVENVAKKFSLKFGPDMEIYEAASPTEHRSTIIWLLGMYDVVQKYQYVSNDLAKARSKVLPHTKLVIVHARVLKNAKGERIRAWWDIGEEGLGMQEDERDVLAAADSVGELVQNEVSNGIRPEAIAVGGFSQGEGPMTPIYWP